MIHTKLSSLCEIADNILDVFSPFIVISLSWVIVQLKQTHAVQTHIYCFGLSSHVTVGSIIC